MIKTGLNFDNISKLVPCFGYSSSFITFSPFEFFIVTGIISCWKYPFFCAFSVFCWDSAAYLSCSSLDIEYFTATFSAESINISKLLKWTNNSEQYYISLPFIQKWWLVVCCFWLYSTISVSTFCMRKSVHFQHTNIDSNVTFYLYFNSWLWN